MQKHLYALCAVTVVLALLATYLWFATAPRAPQLPAAKSSTTSFTAPFTLTNQNGETVTEKTYLGKPTLYFFGFTHCPDICPTTLGALSNWLTELGPDAENINTVFISIDPERDTPQTLKNYLTSFHPTITAATGSDAELQRIARQFMVYYAKVPAKPGEDPKNYMMSHSSMILMADKHGTFMGTLDAHDPDDKALAKLHSLLQP